MLLELGDPLALPELAEHCRLAEELGYPRARWNALTRRATLATITGQLDEAAALIDAAFELGRRIGEPDVFGAAATQGWVLASLGHPTTPFEPHFDAYGRRVDPLIRALALLSSGDRAGAARLLAGYPLADLPRTHDPEPLTFAAWAFAEVGQDEARAELYDLLTPLAGTGSVVGGAAAFQGPVDLYLGLLAAALGRPDRAAEHFRAAAAFARRLGAPAWARLAEQRLGAENLFRREGEVWRLRHAGREVLLPDGKGLHDLATLLAAPGHQVPVHDLLGQVERPTGADPVLDATARAAYRARLEELTAEADEAEADHDLGRAERATTERELLLRELAAAAGLGGRARLLGDETDPAHSLNVMSSTDGRNFSNKVTLGEQSVAAPGIAFVNGVIYLVWAGTDASNSLNVIRSSDGVNFGGKVTLAESSRKQPTLAGADTLVLGWTGIDPGQHLNTIDSTDGGQRWGNKVTYGDTADAGVDLDLSACGCSWPGRAPTRTAA